MAGRRSALAALLLAIATPSTTSASVQASATASAEAVTIIREEWRDPARDRIVPVKLYVPAGIGPFPVVVHSHGLGGSREGSTAILNEVARAGFLVVTLQHAGSDTGILDEGLAALAARDAPVGARAAIDRYRDVPFAIDELTRRNQAEGTLRGRLDLGRIGMSGHSFGALSTLTALGQNVPRAPAGAFREPRIVAGVVYSPNAPRNESPDTAFRAITAPILHFTGTEDRTPLDREASPWGRTIPFQHISGPDQFLVVIHGGDHMLFSGRRMAAGRPQANDAAHLRLITEETIRFWRAYLAADREAAQQLCAIPTRTAALADAYVKASRCGPPTPIRPAP
jgi:predicted dienelactone hydrolase